MIIVFVYIVSMIHMNKGKVLLTESNEISQKVE